MIAAAIWQGAIVAGAVAVVNLVMSFYPSTVVIGGGIGRQPTYFDAVSSLVQRRFNHYLDVLTVVPGSLGDDAALAGAAAWDRAMSPFAVTVRAASVFFCLVAAGSALVAAPLCAAPAAASSIPRHVPHPASPHLWASWISSTLAAAGHGPVSVVLPNKYTAAVFRCAGQEPRNGRPEELAVRGAGRRRQRRHAIERRRDRHRAGFPGSAGGPDQLGRRHPDRIEAQTKGVETITSTTSPSAAAAATSGLRPGDRWPTAGEGSGQLQRGLARPHHRASSCYPGRQTT